MIEQWRELKETIIEMRDNDGTSTQQEVCKFLSNLMDILEKQMQQQEPCEDAISRQAAIDALNQSINILEATDRIVELPSVTPKQRTGHWIETADEYYKAVNEYGGGVNDDTPYFVDDIACSVCLAKYSVIDNETERFDCCPSCGCRMIEPQEREENNG